MEQQKESSIRLFQKVEEYWSEKQYDREELKEQLKKAGQSDETIEKFIEIAEEDEEVFEPDDEDEGDEIENDYAKSA